MSKQRTRMLSRHTGSFVYEGKREKLYFMVIETLGFPNTSALPTLATNFIT